MVAVLSQPGVVAAYGPWAFRESPPWRRRLEVMTWLVLARLSSLVGVPHACGANFGVRREAYFQVGGYTTMGNLAGTDLRLARRLTQVGRVCLCPRMVVYTSNRTYVQQGYIRVFLFWLDVVLQRDRLTAEDWHSWRWRTSQARQALGRRRSRR